MSVAHSMLGLLVALVAPCAVKLSLLCLGCSSLAKDVVSRLEKHLIRLRLETHGHPLTKILLPAMHLYWEGLPLIQAESRTPWMPKHARSNHYMASGLCMGLIASAPKAHVTWANCAGENFSARLATSHQTPLKPDALPLIERLQFQAVPSSQFQTSSQHVAWAVSVSQTRRHDKWIWEQHCPETAKAQVSIVISAALKPGILKSPDISP